MNDQPSQPPKTHMESVVSENWFVAAENVKKTAHQFMEQIEGWCSEKKADILIDIISKMRPEVIVEIGVWGGKSLVPMACALKANNQGIIYGIDPWDSTESIRWVMNESNLAYWSRADHQAVKQRLINNLAQFDLQNQVKLIQSTSEDAAPINEIDLLHIDGNHSEQTSYLDVIKWVPLMKSGGFIIFDDMSWYENNHFTTARAVEWLNQQCIKFAEFSDDCIWGIWIKL